MNEIGQANGQLILSPDYTKISYDLIGELQLWIDGESVISIEGLSFRDDESSYIKGMHFSTFFGGKCSLNLVLNPIHGSIGHSEEWASTKNQRAWFADVSGALLV